MFRYGVSCAVTGSHKRKEHRDLLECEKVKMQAAKGANVIDGGQRVEPQVCIKNLKLNPFDAMASLSSIIHCISTNLGKNIS